MKQTRDWCVSNNGLTQSSNEPSGGDPRLARAMEEYQALLTAGEKPDHGEFLARYPEVAGALADCLSGLDLLHAAAPHLSTPAPLGTPTVGLDAGAPLGDFRLIREVGRGGMGVVYEAEQISLGRRVALKVLPLAATMDPRHLQRFHIEARAAAGLHHSNIVPVYGVGCERGVHYFSMQFIDGRTLAEVIAQQRGAATSNLPTVDEHEAAASTIVPPAAQATRSAPCDTTYFLQVAEWGIQAAEAAGLRPHARRRPPRHQAGQPDGGRDGPAMGHRLRPGPGAERRASDHDRRPGGDVALHVARAGPGPARGDRPPHRRLLAGGDPL